jgi:glycosyltransferase involved in cell wall biosynthesis
MSNPLSVVIISKNEEKFIKDAILSSNFADEVLIVDSGSKDNTCSIASSLGAKVLTQDWLGFGAQKNKAIELAKNDWVFVLDSDERITPELQSEIHDILSNPIFDGYFVARLNLFFGKFIKTCGLYPDYTIRLFNKKKGKFNDVAVHESVFVEGKTSKLSNHMLHLAYDNFDEFLIKQKKYAKLNNKKHNIYRALSSACWVFIKIFILKLGFIDGWRGFLIAKGYAQYNYWKYTC